MNLQVVFGTGPVGPAVMRELLARGRQVRAVSRGGRARLPAGVEHVIGDASDPAFAGQVCRGAEVGDLGRRGELRVLGLQVRFRHPTGA